MAIRNKTQLLLALAALHVAVFAAGAADAANLTIAITQSPGLGTVSASSGSATTLFPVSTSGSLGTVSGGGSKTSHTSAKQAIVTITCAANAKCQGNAVTVTVKASTLSGRAASLSNFTGTATPPSGTVTGSGASQMTLTFASGMGTKNTKVAAPVAVDIGATFGVAGDKSNTSSTGSWVMTVEAKDANGDDSGAVPVTATATVDFGLSITNIVTLDFGRIASSAIGGTVDYPAGSGVMNVPSDVKSLGSPHLGSVTVNGGAGTIVSVSVTTTPMGSFSWTPTISPGGAVPLPATSGGAGSQAFAIGGKFTMPAGAAAGVYSGTYTVTASYN